MSPPPGFVIGFADHYALASPRLRGKADHEGCHGVAGRAKRSRGESGLVPGAGHLRRPVLEPIRVLAHTPSMRGVHYVYILVSESDPDRHDTGLTCNLGRRLKAHNAGQVAHTSKHRPWRIKVAIAFRSHPKATGFERYLKTHSKRAITRIGHAPATISATRESERRRLSP